MTIRSIAIVTPPGVTVVTAPYAPAGPILAGTSSTSNDISIGGEYTWMMDQVGLGFTTGIRVRAASTVDPTQWLEGVITEWDGTDLTMVSDLASGFEIFSSWSIGVAGQPGKTGQKGDSGAVGPIGPQGLVSLDSPAFVGNPTVPTPLPEDNDLTVANTQWVKNLLVNYQPFDSDLVSLAAASAVGAMYYRSAADTWGPVTIGSGLSFVSGTLSLSSASFDSPIFTGDPKSVTVAKTDSDTTIATTGFVHSVTADYAPLDSAALTGTPTTPTPAGTSNDGTIANTQFVKTVAAGLQPLDPDLTALAAAGGTNVWYYRSGPDTWAPVTIGANLLFAGGTLSAVAGGGSGGGVPADSPVFTGDPQGPTPPLGDNDASIPNTSWVQRELTAYAKLLSPSLQGQPLAPTPPASDNSLRLATTEFVQAKLGVYLPTTGGNVTGNITLVSTSPWLNFYSDITGSARLVSGTAAGIARWSVVLDDGTAETGSNAGSNFNISRYTDGGVLIDTPIAIDRGTGVVALMAATVPTAAAGDAGAKVASTGYVDNAITVLKGGASAAYDTLGEIQTAIVAKAPLDTPTFVGAPAAPTPTPSTDNSSRVATTAFVQAAVQAAIAGLGGTFSTGDVKATIKTVADTGWVMMNDGTIGDASSTATTRANVDCQSLFTLAWNNISNTYAAVLPGGRGASAAADWAAHKTIALPKVLGRVLGGAGAGAGLASRSLGQILGEELHSWTGSELIQHSHGVYDPNHSHVFLGYQALIQASYTTVDPGSSYNVCLWGGGIGNTSAAATSISTQATGSSTAANVMQPTTFVNYMIKL